MANSESQADESHGSTVGGLRRRVGVHRRARRLDPRWLAFSAVLLAIAALSCASTDRLAENKALVRRYLEEILNRGDFTALAQILPDSGFVLNGHLMRAGDVQGMRAHLLAQFPDFRLVIEDQVAEGDRVVTRVSFHGTHSGEYQGIPPTGRRVSYGGIAIDRIQDGKVTEGWHLADDWELLRQLGARLAR